MLNKTVFILYKFNLRLLRTVVICEDYESSVRKSWEGGDDVGNVYRLGNLGKQFADDIIDDNYVLPHVSLVQFHEPKSFKSFLNFALNNQ